MLPTKLRGVIFDLDGTIANTLPLGIAAFRCAIEPLAGRTLTNGEIVATFGPSEEGTIRALAPDHYERGLADYLRHYEALHDVCPDVFPEMRDLLTHLKARGVRLGMVTGKGAKSAWFSLRRFGMETVFDPVETGDPTGPRKVEGIRRILAQWKMEQSEAAYVGDSPTDVTAAREAGIAVIGAGWSETTDRALLAVEKPDALALTVSDLKSWLEDRVR